MDSNRPFIWIRALLSCVGVAVPALAVGLLLGPDWGWGLLALGLAALLLRQAFYFARLLRWLERADQPLPRGSGAWELAFSDLYRLMRSIRREREHLLSEVGRFRSAGAALPDGVVILDSQNHIEWCNPTAERYFGIDIERDVGRQILNLVRTPDLARYFERGDFSQPLNLRLSRAEDLVLSLRVIPYGQDQRLLLSRDITQAERIEGMRRDFVANVSHELKTPLTVVHGFVETLAEGTVSMTGDRIKGVLALMQQQTTRMLRLIEDLLTLSALESSPGQAGESLIDLQEMLTSLHAEGLALSSGRHRLELKAEAGALLGEEKDLRSAFGNLLSNAIRYTPAGGTIRLGWRIRESGEGEFAVSDTGVGIEPRHIPRLTERFYRVDQGRSRETGGTGLGLAIVKHVLNRHQAVLDVQSEPGKGSLFMAVFPSRRVRRDEKTPLPA